MAAAKWRRYSRVAYPSATHGGRFVNNYANDAAHKYAGFEKAGQMPEGAVLAKDSFGVSKAGAVSVGPLFLMEKMAKGFNKASGDWRYTMIMPDGSVFGVTNGKGSARMKFCAECHAAVGETQDHMFFLPAEYRVK
ncbi:MAG: cytochrome P460 family protein [Alphaproteobacteria bacterium]|nr:cytochrome P460 family protein [Alphaproteobacteria bacterium]